jgi:hypothetical protein
MPDGFQLKFPLRVEIGGRSVLGSRLSVPEVLTIRLAERQQLAITLISA